MWFLTLIIPFDTTTMSFDENADMVGVVRLRAYPRTDRGRARRLCPTDAMAHKL